MKTYLFDIGNVLLAFDFSPALNALMGSNPAPNAIQDIIARKDAFEAGQIPVENYIAWASELLDFGGDPDAFKHAWRHIFTPIEGTWKLAEQLKAEGHRLILYSNTNAIHASHCLDTYDVFKHFDHAVFSHEIGAIKPHDDFFTRSFDQFAILPEQTYYIDDLAENVAAGRAHGLNAHQYSASNHQALLDWIATH
ncbi:HAD family hydrolase [Rubritalea tangerina]|uniref:HAD family hydrolase n=1 Tax=Rubritalea tangerina TaxID=430798 RepID=A0ABW4Z783_9BACT